MSDLQRERFEAWAKQYDYDLTWSSLIDNYNFSVTRILFDTWQAAIESVVVELPKARSDIDYGYELNDIHNLLTDAGIKYE